MILSKRLALQKYKDILGKSLGLGSFARCLKNALQKNQAKSLLDIGGGDGFMAHNLGQAFKDLAIVLGHQL